MCNQDPVIALSKYTQQVKTDDLYTAYHHCYYNYHYSWTRGQQILAEEGLWAKTLFFKECFILYFQHMMDTRITFIEVN